MRGVIGTAWQATFLRTGTALIILRQAWAGLPLTSYFRSTCDTKVQTISHRATTELEPGRVPLTCAATRKKSFQPKQLQQEQRHTRSSCISDARRTRWRLRSAPGMTCHWPIRSVCRIKFASAPAPHSSSYAILLRIYLPAIFPMINFATEKKIFICGTIAFDPYQTLLFQIIR